MGKQSRKSVPVKLWKTRPLNISITVAVCHHCRLHRCLHHCHDIAAVKITSSTYKLAFFSQMRISRKVAESIKLAGFNTIYDLGAPSHLLCKFILKLAILPLFKYRLMRN